MTTTTSSTSSSSNRITGLASGLDTDALVKTAMKGYQSKVDKKIQEKAILEIKQKQYRQVLTDTRAFYNKYLDIAKTDSLVKTGNYKSVAFTSGDSSIASATTMAGAKIDNYTVTVSKLAKPASKIIDDTALTNTNSIAIKAKDSKGVEQTITVNKGTLSNEAFAAELNTKLSSVGMKADYSQLAKGLVIETKNYGKDSTFSIDINNTTTFTTINNGQNLNATISNGTTVSYEIKDGSNVTTNETTLDNVTFKFSKVATTTLTGKTDITDIKDKITKFVDDYNTMITNLNKSVATKHTKSYTPLTADQKKEMSESEIKLWNEKVEEGQLYRDSDVSRIANSMKEAMRSMMEATGMKLETIGINPVKDYSGTTNGTFKIDDEKLTKALESNIDDVVNLFTGKPTATNPTDLEKTQQTGVLWKLEDILDKESMKSDSLLAQKVGIEGTASFTTNTFTKQISEYENKITDMEKDLKRREQALYSKYATLETILNNYSSQQSYLMQAFGS